MPLHYIYSFRMIRWPVLVDTIQRNLIVELDFLIDVWYGRTSAYFITVKS